MNFFGNFDNRGKKMTLQEKSKSVGRLDVHLLDRDTFQTSE